METQQHIFGKSAESRKFMGEQAGGKEGLEDLGGGLVGLWQEASLFHSLHVALNLPQRIGLDLCGLADTVHSSIQRRMRGLRFLSKNRNLGCLGWSATCPGKGHLGSQ